MFGKLIKLALDIIRANDRMTTALWGLTVHRKLMAITWDLTSFCLKKAFDQEFGQGGRASPKRFLDMGTGQVGLLGQYVKQVWPETEVCSVDIYPEFLENARYNAELNGLSITYIESNLFSALGGQTFDAMSFNPPYVPEAPDDDLTYRRIRYSGHDGSEATRAFLAQAGEFLAPGGRVFMGINCFYLPEETCQKVFDELGYLVENVYRRTANTARVFILRPQEAATTQDAQIAAS